MFCRDGGRTDTGQPGAFGRDAFLGALVAVGPGLAWRLSQLQCPGGWIEQAGDIVPGALGEGDADVDIDEALGRGEPAEGSLRSDAECQCRIAAPPAQDSLPVCRDQRRPNRRRERNRPFAGAQIEQGNIDPGALGDELLLPVMLALQRPGDGNLTIARALRVGIAADHAGDAGAVASAAAHADHDVDLLARAHAPAVDIAGDWKHQSLYLSG